MVKNKEEFQKSLKLINLALLKVLRKNLYGIHNRHLFPLSCKQPFSQLLMLETLFEWHKLSAYNH